ncbi:MAG: outer membrane lipoprotein carrier protein LolA [Bacteroidales bacterium]|nr:outer membrane lipoprotein carrier protein LolA [Bacteroidales bacterium]
MKLNQIIRPVILAVLLLLPAFIAGAQGSPSPAKVAADVAAKLRNTPGLKAEFRIDAGGHTSSGSLLVAGSKFRIMTGAYSAWYDGKSLYTLNPRSKETTVVSPTPSELREANPLLFINGASDSYSLSFSSHQPAGKYMLVLTPKRKGDSLKSVFITIDRKSLLPESMVVTTTDGAVSTLTISSLQLNMKVGAGIFIYPRSKYPAFRIVDLR